MQCARLASRFILSLRSSMHNKHTIGNRKYSSESQAQPQFNFNKIAEKGNWGTSAISGSTGSPARATELTGDDAMTFGKYKGMPLSSIPNSYVEWMANNGILNRNEALRHVFVKLGKIEPFKPFTYMEHLAGVLNKDEKIPYQMCGYSFEMPNPPPGTTTLFGDNPPSWRELSSESKAALEPHMEVPASLPKNVLFFDLESVYTTDISDIANSYICQVGAIDGEGNEFVSNIHPPCHFYDVSKQSNFFIEYGFQRFFAPENPNFITAWPKVADWFFKSNGRNVEEQPVIMIGHNIVRYDLLLLDQELRRISPVELSGARPLMRTGPQRQSTLATKFATISRPPTGFTTWRDHFFQQNTRFFDTFSALPMFTGLPWSPGRGAWSLSGLHRHATTRPMRGLAHDAIVDVAALRDVFFASNILGAFFRAELARCLERPFLPPEPVLSNPVKPVEAGISSESSQSARYAARKPSYQSQSSSYRSNESSYVENSPYLGDFENGSPQTTSSSERPKMPQPPSSGSFGTGFISE